MEDQKKEYSFTVWSELRISQIFIGIESKGTLTIVDANGKKNVCRGCRKDCFPVSGVDTGSLTIMMNRAVQKAYNAVGPIRIEITGNGFDFGLFAGEKNGKKKMNRRNGLWH